MPEQKSVAIAHTQLSRDRFTPLICQQGPPHEARAAGVPFGQVAKPHA